MQIAEAERDKELTARMLACQRKWGGGKSSLLLCVCALLLLLLLLCYSSLVKKKKKIACLCDHVAQCTVFYYCHVLSIFLVNQTKHCLSVDLYCYYSHFSLSFHLIQFMSLSDFYSVIINPPK